MIKLNKEINEHEIQEGRLKPYQWRDQDNDVEGQIRQYVDHPTIVAVLNLKKNNFSSIGIYIDKQQRREIIDWLGRIDD